MPTSAMMSNLHGLHGSCYSNTPLLHQHSKPMNTNVLLIKDDKLSSALYVFKTFPSTFASLFKQETGEIFLPYLRMSTRVHLSFVLVAMEDGIKLKIKLNWSTKHKTSQSRGLENHMST